MAPTGPSPEAAFGGRAGARALGFQPEQDAEQFAAERIARFGPPDLSDPVHDLVGGAYCRTPLGEPMA